MPRKESLYPKDWFRIGEKEIQRAENLLRFEDLEGAGFNIEAPRRKQRGIFDPMRRACVFNKQLKNSSKVISFPKDGR